MGFVIDAVLIKGGKLDNTVFDVDGRRHSACVDIIHKAAAVAYSDKGINYVGHALGEHGYNAVGVYAQVLCECKVQMDGDYILGLLYRCGSGDKL